MHKKFISLALTALLLALCSSAAAQQPAKVPQIGYLSNAVPAVDTGRREAIRQALRVFGYVEGQNISTLYRSGEGNVARYPGLLAELVNLKVDIIIVSGGS